MINRIHKYVVFILSAACLWGCAGIFIRSLAKYDVPEMQIVLERCLLSSVILAIIIAIKNKALFKIRLKDLWAFLGSGIVSVTFFNFCYYKTMSYTSLSVSAVLMYTAPFFVVIFSLFLFKEKIGIRKIVACLIAFLGCCFVTGLFGSSQHLSRNALIFGLLTGFGYSLYTVFGRILIDKHYHSLTITFYTFLFASIGCLPFINVTNFVKVNILNPNVSLIIFLMAIFNTVLPYIFYTSGLEGVEASAAPVLATIEPVVATLVGLFIYNEKITLSGVFGIILVLSAVAILNMKAGATNEHNKASR